MTRYHNKTTKILQTVFSVLCFIGAAILGFMLVNLIIPLATGQGIALAFMMILILIGGSIGLGLFLIPWILLLIFCQKPWLSLAAYLTFALLFIACILTVAIGA